MILRMWLLLLLIGYAKQWMPSLLVLFLTAYFLKPLSPNLSGWVVVGGWRRPVCLVDEAFPHTGLLDSFQDLVIGINGSYLTKSSAFLYAWCICGGIIRQKRKKNDFCGGKYFLLCL